MAAAMFQPQELERLAPRLHRAGREAAGLHPVLDHGERLNGKGSSSSESQLEPLAATEAIAYDFLAKGGKHSRPFITLAAYRALGAHQRQDVDEVPDAVKRCALSIETFHKASLVHDDIEDDDEFRYGAPTLHRKFGTPTAINVGDYLIGMGYRLVTREAKSLGPEMVADLLDHIADAHVKLSEGQGAELMWRDSHNKRLTPNDALQIYALKTAPAFAAALHTGLRLAGPTERYVEAVGRFAHDLGVAFQIINDLNDWQGDNHNKLRRAGDVIGGRPTLLWAVALAGLGSEQRKKLESMVDQQPLEDADLREIYCLYESGGAFQQARSLVEKYQKRAESLAAQIEPEPLQQLFYHLIDMVLERRQM
jgi:geranylgeranyl pyrophosphate synthase